MFGYVKPHQPELLVKEYEFYRATYCGICRAMKKHTGALSNITLSYDSVFLALLRMLFISDSEFAVEKRRCIAHPMKRRAMLKENPAIEYTARAFAILAYHKALDDLNDESLGKKMLIAPSRPILKGGAKKAKIPSLAELIADRLRKITELESARVESVDEPASLFGELLGEVFAYGLEQSDRLVMYQCGYHLGCFIYAADAAEDYEEDVRLGKYNPYALIYGGKTLTSENKETIKCALLLECKQIEAAVNLMPFGERRVIENIIKNIIYLGLVKRISFLDKNTDKEK